MNCSSSLKLLSQQYPTASSALDKIAQTEAALTLDRRVTHVISDIHGEHKKLRHVINNASGGLRRLVDEIFSESLNEEERNRLLAHLYYPVEKMRSSRTSWKTQEERLATTKTILRQQFRIVQHLAKNITREKLLKLIDEDHEALFLALLDEQSYRRDHAYVDSMLHALADYEQDIHAVHMASRLVRNLAISDIVVAGDLADRGERVDKVIHFLKAQPKVEITWGNHDITWMGAALGSEVMIATVLRISLRYLRLWQLEEGYGILLAPLASLAKTVYKNDPAERFFAKRTAEFSDTEVIARMHKAIAILEFKLSGSLIAKHPEWEMDGRRLLHKIDYENGSIELDGVTYPLVDSNFPTIDPADPYALSAEESQCMDRLKESFTSSQRLWEHMLFVVKRGAMSLRRDHVLIFHACVPTCEDGHFRSATIHEKKYSGPELFNKLEGVVRETYRQGASMVSDDLDLYYWMWASGKSPLFGKDQMTTFERYFIDDPATHKEVKDPYFDMIHDADYCKKVGAAFGMEDDVIIVNGHVPVKIAKGEDPVKRGGNAVTIDGAFSEAYGDYGYTLMLDPGGISLAEHSHFESIDHFLNSDQDMQPKLRNLCVYDQRRSLSGTHESQFLHQQLTALNMLLEAYRSGELRER